jgi:hypothetical protein
MSSVSFNADAGAAKVLWRPSPPCDLALDLTAEFCLGRRILVSGSLYTRGRTGGVRFSIHSFYIAGHTDYLYR